MTLDRLTRRPDSSYTGPMASSSVTVRYPADLLEQIDAVAGPKKRTEWLIAAARAALAPRPATEAFDAQPRVIEPPDESVALVQGLVGVASRRTPRPRGQIDYPSPSVRAMRDLSSQAPREVSPRFRDPKAGRL